MKDLRQTAHFNKKMFLQGELELAASCRKRIDEGEAAAVRRTLPLTALQADREYHDLLDTACVFLLDCDGSVTRTAEMLFLHKNTIKYRLQRSSGRARRSCRPPRPPRAFSMRFVDIYNKWDCAVCPLGQAAQSFFLPIRQYSSLL